MRRWPKSRPSLIGSTIATDVIAAVVRRFPPNGPIFDVGGGNGYVSLGLKRAGFDCIVVEPGEVGAANAAQRGFPVIRAPFQNLTLGDETILAAGMFDVLEHIEDDLGALANLHRVLKRDGRLYIAVPAHRWLWLAEDVAAGHYRRYTLRSLRVRLQQAGFAIELRHLFFRNSRDPDISDASGGGLRRQDVRGRCETGSQPAGRCRWWHLSPVFRA